MKNLIFLILFFLSSSRFIFAEVEKLDSTTTVLFEMAVKHVEAGDYNAANHTFLELLSPKKLMPDNLTYFFGKSLYHTGGYRKQCMDFLNKYIQLRGDTGKYYDETVVMLKSLGQEFHDHIDTTDQRPTAQRQLDKCEGGQEFVICPICNGTNVLSSGAAFGSAFKECNYCDERGVMPCANYKKYIDESILIEYSAEE